MRVHERHGEARGEDADDRVRLAVNHEHRPEGTAAAQRVAPETIADDRHELSWLTLALEECPALRDGRRHHREQSGGHTRGRRDRRLLVQRDDTFGKKVALEPGQRPDPFAKAGHFHLLQRISLQAPVVPGG
jgi:hypothetical protein